MKNSLKYAVCMMTSLVLVTNAWAQKTEAWPSKNVRILVPYAAGGPADLVARELAQVLANDLKQSVTVENMGGAMGVPALSAVARADADGHTLLLSAMGNMVLQPILSKHGGGELITKLKPIGTVSTAPHVLVVSSKLEEYKSLVSVIEEMATEGVEVRGVPVTLEFKYLVQFMVNSFIRPSDLRVLRRPHVKVQINPAATRNADKHYLLLTHPATKTTDQEVVTMPAAYGIYQSLVKFQDQKVKALKAKKSKVVDKFTDHLFFPEYSNRDTMIAVAGRIFRKAVQRAKLEKEGEKHTLYSLRHTSIMYRLLLGNTSTLELARNARTSQAMIDKHYASRLTPMMAVDSIHSFKANTAPAKTPVKKVTKKATATKVVIRKK